MSQFQIAADGASYPSEGQGASRPVVEVRMPREIVLPAGSYLALPANATDGQKRDYYTYGPGGWSYKQPPAIPESLRDALTALRGRDEHGDPVYRFLWAGVAVERQSAEDKFPVVHGSRDACHFTPTLITKEGLLIPPRLEPRYLYVKARQLRCFWYRDGRGRPRRAERQDQVPAGAFSRAEFKYVSYGKLFWYLQRKLSAEQLVAAGVYRADDPNLPRRGDYISILQLQDKGRYLEPTAEWLEVVGRYVREVESERPRDLMRRDVEQQDAARERREQEEAARDREQFSEEADKLIEGNVGRTYSY